MAEAPLDGDRRYAVPWAGVQQRFAHLGETAVARVAHRRDAANVVEVLVERAMGDACGGGNVADRHRIVEVRSDELRRALHVGQRVVIVGEQ